MIDFINNTWFVSIASIIIGAVATWLIGWVREWNRARNGYLTGSYFAYSQNRDDSHIIVEAVRLRHVGRDLSGNSKTMLELHLGGGGDYSGLQWEAKPYDDEEYEYTGRQVERQVMLIYSSKTPGSQLSGTVALKLGSVREVLSGTWAGTGYRDKIASNRCIWVRRDVDHPQSADLNELGRQAMQALQGSDNPWLKNYPSTPESAQG